MKAIHDGRRFCSWGELAAEAEAAARRLRREGVRVLATALDNSPAFVALDEAARDAGCVHVPLPLFFTPAQMRHAVEAAGVDALLVDPPLAQLWPALGWEVVDVAGRMLLWARCEAKPVALPPATAKITFTSGTTGTPKGVCLSGAAMRRVTESLVATLAPFEIERHLSALPFAVLLENIAGVMASRRHGVLLQAMPLAEIGLTGSSSFDAARFHAAVEAHRPHSTILLPQMLRAWCGHLMQTRQRAPASLKLVAVGGAAVGAPLITAALSLGIPACEGYGLSEGCSVQTLNLPGAQRPGSVGRVLPHARIRVAADGELQIAGSLFCGYLGDPAPVPAWWPTGDLGRIDGDGFVHVQGRKKNVLITGFGRNVSPEWIETTLGSHPAVLQSVVLGDGEAALSAVLWPVSPAVGDDALSAAVNQANAVLPDYARIGRWTRGRAAFDPSTGLATGNGRPQRHAIAALHADALELRSAVSP